MLKLTDVSKKYKNDFAVRKINLSIERGKLYLFVGDNGSGKSTTIKLISKVIFKKAKDGKINNQFNRILYLPDHCSYPNLLTVKGYLSMFLARSYDEHYVDEKLNQYELENKTIGSLSKGNLKKLGIIQVILSKGELYLFDEPQDGLDRKSCLAFKEDIKKLIDGGASVIISTHLKTLFKDLKPNVVNFSGGKCSEKKQASNA